MSRPAELLASCAVAPSPEQRLEGVLDLSPNFVGGEVTKEVARGKRLAPEIDGDFEADDWLFRAKQNRAG